MAHHGGMGTWACLGMCLVMMVPMVLPALVGMVVRKRRSVQGRGRCRDAIWVRR